MVADRIERSGFGPLAEWLFRPCNELAMVSIGDYMGLSSCPVSHVSLPPGNEQRRYIVSKSPATLQVDWETIRSAKSTLQTEGIGYFDIS